MRAPRSCAAWGESGIESSRASLQPGPKPNPHQKPNPSPLARWEYTFELSCLEIYNEELRDMLNRGNDKLKVVDSGAEVAVPGLSQLPVANVTATC